jgi:hypothetical protein
MKTEKYGHIKKTKLVNTNEELLAQFALDLKR